MPDLCHCGQPLHYGSPETERYMKSMVKKLGEFTKVTARGRTWLVSRHYVALHGMKAAELHTLGFEEVGSVAQRN
jgi:hypothetical protein